MGIFIVLSGFATSDLSTGNHRISVKLVRGAEPMEKRSSSVSRRRLLHSLRACFPTASVYNSSSLIPTARRKIGLGSHCVALASLSDRGSGIAPMVGL
uniref:Uncharacterized protein n=1 Tax=Edwardsiella tarda TaxID=636 RepID=A0A2S1PMK5_EDWTA|nr:hypothetical protein [Edwardsiella tarda]